MTTGEKIKAVRKAKNLSQSTFAEPLHVTAAYVSQLESGKKQPSETLTTLLMGYYLVNGLWWETGEGEMFQNVAKFRKFADRVNETQERYPDLTPGTPRDLYEKVLKRAVENVLEGIDDANEQEAFVARALSFFQGQKRKKDRD